MAQSPIRRRTAAWTWSSSSSILKLAREQFPGVTFRPRPVEVVGQIGFNGILVALLGRVKPWGVVGAAFLFGALQAGGAAMQTFSGISNELVTVIQAMIVIFVAAPLLVKAIFRLRRSPIAASQAALAKG